MMFDGAASSAAATLVSNPFDVMRTRMQLQGELCKAGEYHVVYRNMAQGMIRVVREEGFFALQKGLSPAILWQITQNGVRIGLYPAVKAEVAWATGGESFGGAVAAAAFCGTAGAMLASPFVLVKTRLQSQRNTMKSLRGFTLAETSTGTQYHYVGVWDALRQIYKKGGIRGLWHGVFVAAQRTAVGSATQLVAYDYAKKWGCKTLELSPSDVRVHVLSAVIASCAVVMFMNPLDVVMTRAYNHHASGPRIYSNNLSAATWKIYRVEGLRGLYKGSVALFSRSAPHTVVTFVVLEWLRKLREAHTNRSYTSGSVVKATVGFREQVTDTSVMTPAAATK